MKEIHVSNIGNNITGDGSITNPYKTIQYALNYVEKGTNIIIHKGVYDSFVINKNCSGTKDEQVTIKPYENDKVIIQGIWDEESITIHMVNVENIIIDGLEIVGGGLGIYCISDSSIGNKVLENITITNCLVHKIRGMHGIAIYAKNDLAPIKNVVINNCEVYDCRLDSSESVVINGNIDGFDINNNIIHDNNNIGIDMIGFEGKALHDDSYQGNKYDADYVRNGKCHNNFVYNISSFDNEAYYDLVLASPPINDGEYNLCANGIYVDGAQDIEIYDNFVYNCDIGIEVATEHSPDDNELFKVSGISVHDNFVADCINFTGLAFGGYDYNLGYTRNCDFYNNTFIDGNIAIEVQRSNNNNIHNNLIIDCDKGLNYNDAIRQDDLLNNIENNIFCRKELSYVDYFKSNKYDYNDLLNVNKQIFDAERTNLLCNYISINNDYGSRYKLKEEEINNYEKYHYEGKNKINEIINYLNTKYKNGLIIDRNENICTHINEDLINAGYMNTKVELIKYKGNQKLVNTNRNTDNGTISNNEEISNIVAEFHIFYSYDKNSWSHAWLKKVNIKVK